MIRMDPQVQDVFKVSGIPTITFVEPADFTNLRVSLRTRGRGLVIEGPSGIGKSTAVYRALEAEGIDPQVTTLSARVPAEVDYIEVLHEIDNFGLVIIDDYHRLPAETRAQLADLLKVLADSEDPNRKLVIVGINQAGQSLIHFAPDLANRIDIIRMEVEQPDRVEELVAKGEKALNIAIGPRAQIVEAARGSFYIAQLLSLQICMDSKIMERAMTSTPVNSSFTACLRTVMERQERRFGANVKEFARGPRFRSAGRAPYLHILKWLRESANWSISLPDQIALHPAQRVSVSQVVDKGYLASFAGSFTISELFHFDPLTKVLSIEDPHLAFFVQNLDWPKFVSETGFTNFEVDKEYDVALSFAGEDRKYAEKLFNYLSDEEFSVFYDFNEGSRMLAENVEDFLRPIYESEARFVVAVLGATYGVRRWTVFESDAFKDRFDKGEVIPIWSSEVPPSAFDKAREVGYLEFDPAADLDSQAKIHAESIARKISQAIK